MTNPSATSSSAGYRLMQEYILTQHPVASTVLDFWQMVWDYRATTVTCLSPEVSALLETAARWGITGWLTVSSSQAVLTYV